MSACKLVTVKKKIPLFKGKDKANAIELIELEEVGNMVVSQKDLYEIGDKAVFIEPDFCLPDTQLFESFIRPNGDNSKSKLGKNGRIKAIKFNLHIGDGMPVYSYGILMPFDLIQVLTVTPVSIMIEGDKLDEFLGITKYEEPDEKSPSSKLGGSSKNMPEGMYKTDETNINNLWGNIKYPITLIGSLKVDGSSITLYSRLLPDGKRVSGICSRNFDIPLTYRKKVGKIKHPLSQRIFLSIKKFCVGLTEEDIYQFEEVASDSEFVTIGKPYLDKFVAFCTNLGTSAALRGELNGKGLKGSGNKNNPSTKEEPNIKFYAADDYRGGITKRTGEEEFNNVIEELDFERCKKYFTRKMRCKADIVNLCESIIAKEKANGNIIEGIVLKTPDGGFSCKYMNMYYDSMK